MYVDIWRMENDHLQLSGNIVAQASRITRALSLDIHGRALYIVYQGRTAFPVCFRVHKVIPSLSDYFLLGSHT